MATRRDELTWMHVIVRVGLNSVTHPIEYAKVLIQIGHEPLPPYQGRTFFGREKMFYPSVFKYIGHIKKRDGFLGCYRGLTPKLAANIVSGLVFQKVTESIKYKELDGPEVDVDSLTLEEKHQRFLQNTVRESAGRVAAIIVSQPLHVIAVRCMAEFVGEEGKYMGIFASIRIVYKEDGVSGFFSGLIPRLLCDLGALWIGNILIHVINNYIVEDKDLKTYVSASMRFLSSAILYPLQVVANCMAVNGTSLAAGSPPNMPLYENWLDCYRHLRQIRELKRGSSLLWRAYPGATILAATGPVVPTSDMFAPPAPSIS